MIGCNVCGGRALQIVIGIMVLIILQMAIITITIAGSPPSNPVEFENKTIIDGFKAYTWFNGDREKQVFAARDEVAIFPKKVSEKSNVMELILSFDAQSTLIKDYEFVALVRLPNRLDITVLEDKMVEFHKKTGNKANFVFYQGPKKDQAPMALTGEIIVKFKPDWNETKIVGWSKGMEIDIIKSFPFSPDTYLFNAGPGIRSLEIANQIYLSGQVVYAYPNWWKAMELKNNQTILNDMNISKENETTSNSSEKAPFISNVVAIVLIILIIYIYRRK